MTHEQHSHTEDEPAMTVEELEDHIAQAEELHRDLASRLEATAQR